MAPQSRSWALETARAMMGEVRDRTARAVEEVEALADQREALAASDPRAQQIDARIQELVSLWARSMEALGLEVKGLWLVDFDNGSGYYCWKWPESELAFYHGYDEGFGGRIRIQ